MEFGRDSPDSVGVATLSHNSPLHLELTRLASQDPSYELVDSTAHQRIPSSELEQQAGVQNGRMGDDGHGPLIGRLWNAFTNLVRGNTNIDWKKYKPNARDIIGDHISNVVEAHRDIVSEKVPTASKVQLAQYCSDSNFLDSSNSSIFAAKVDVGHAYTSSQYYFLMEFKRHAPSQCVEVLRPLVH